MSLWHCDVLIYRWRREWTHRPVIGKDGIGDRKEICFKTVHTSLLQEPPRPVATHVPLASPLNLPLWLEPLLPTLELYLVAEDVNVPHCDHRLPPKFNTIFHYILTKVYIFTHLSFKSQLSFFFLCVCLCRFFSTSGLLASTASQHKKKEKKKTTFHEKEKFPKCCWFCLINSNCSSSVSLSSTQRNKNIMPFFVFLEVYKLI